MTNRDLLLLLIALEWRGNGYDPTRTDWHRTAEKVCPMCRRLDYEGHRADCTLSAAITALTTRTRDPG